MVNLTRLKSKKMCLFYIIVWLGRLCILDNRAIVLASLIIRVKHFHHVEVMELINLFNQPYTIRFEGKLTFRFRHILSHLRDDQAPSFI